MQIDFIGCTSGGKSTLLNNTIKAGRAQGIETLTRETFILQRLRLDWLRGHGPRMFMVDLVALATCLRTWRTHRAGYRFVAATLSALPIPLSEKFYLLRNVLRRFGVHEVIRRHSKPEQVILVDEGTLQIAHNLFVHHAGEPIQVGPDVLAAFAALMPMPDVVVYVRLPAPLLIERTIQRGHRRLANASYEGVASFIHQAIAVFDTLIQDPDVASRLLTVDDSRIVTHAGDPENPDLARAMDLLTAGIMLQAEKMPLHPSPSPPQSAEGGQEMMQELSREEAIGGEAPHEAVGMERAK